MYRRLVKKAFGVIRPIIVIMFVLGSSAFTCFAFTARTGESLIIGGSEVINDDLYLAGETIVIDGKVNGSLFAAGSSITINGVVRDNVVVAGRKITILGNVGRGVKALGETVNVEGRIGGDAMFGSREVILDRQVFIGGDLLFGASKVFIECPVEGSVYGGAADLVIDNHMKGKVKVGVKNLTLTGGARVDGDLTYISENEADIRPGSEVSGKIEHILPEYEKKFKTIFPFILLGGIIGKIIGFLMALVVGLVAILITTRFINTSAENIMKKPGPCAGWGAVLFFGTPVGVLLAFVTIIGIPLGSIVMLLYLVSLYISEMVVALLVGKLIFFRVKKTDEKSFLFGAFALGLFIIRLLRFIPVIGWIIRFVVALFGLGAILLSVAAKVPTAQVPAAKLPAAKLPAENKSNG
jgi:cytoskeletal protein CcmA (bactofilin family)